MKLLLHFILPFIFVTTSRSSLFSDIKGNILSLMQNNDDKIRKGYAVPRAHYKKNQLTYEKDREDYMPHFQLDPVLNYFRRQGKQKQRSTFKTKTDEIDSAPESFRKQRERLKISRRRGSTSESSSSSSSRELMDWKDEWKEKWIKKKFEAINSTYVPGDAVNMLEARPWGVPCGDPNQHDMPWGSCVLPLECDAEYRIYRGDYHCGRTQLICCAMQLTAYDMYQGFDLSFESSGLETDTEEDKLEGTKEHQRKHRKHKHKKRKRARTKRKKQLEREIKKIQKEIRVIMKKQERNATDLKKMKTRQLKRFGKMLKRQYEKDKKAVVDMHNVEMIKIDGKLKNKLEQIMLLNQNFSRNTTFRDVIVNGTLNRLSARMLIEAYPELDSYINLNVKRRSGGGEAQDYLYYDVEYGMLYF